MNKQVIIDLVLQQIINDVRDCDVTAIEEMIKHLDIDTLIAYLPEDTDLTVEEVKIEF